MTVCQHCHSRTMVRGECVACGANGPAAVVADSTTYRGLRCRWCARPVADGDWCSDLCREEWQVVHRHAPTSPRHELALNRETQARELYEHGFSKEEVMSVLGLSETTARRYRPAGLAAGARGG